jgi:hypothetical protein
MLFFGTCPTVAGSRRLSVPVPDSSSNLLSLVKSANIQSSPAVRNKTKSPQYVVMKFNIEDNLLTNCSVIYLVAEPRSLEPLTLKAVIGHHSELLPSPTYPHNPFLED